MKRNHYIGLVLAVFLLGLVVFTARYEKLREAAAETVVHSNSQPTARSLITTALPVRRTFTFQVSWIGTVETQASVELTALVAGRIEAINAKDQQRIEKGQRVMQLGGPRIEAARARLSGEIESMKTQVDLASQTLERLKESLKTQLATKDQVAAAQETTVKLNTQLREARLSLKTLEDQTNITATMDGIFTNRRVSVGQEVNSGQVVGEIINTGRLRIAASVFPPQGVELQGKAATIHLSGNQTLTGHVGQVLPQASRTGALTVWIEGPQIDTQLKPGQMVGGDIVVKVNPDALAVPESAVVYDSQEQPYVFIRKGSAYEPLSIRAGLEQDGWVEILSGLKQDQSVVTQGAYELFYRKFNEQFKVQD